VGDVCTQPGGKRHEVVRVTYRGDRDWSSHEGLTAAGGGGDGVSAEPTTATCYLCDEPITDVDSSTLCEDCLARCYWCNQHCDDDPCEGRQQADAGRAEYERWRAAEPPSRCLGRWHWRRWRLTGAVFSLLYVSGVTANGGSSGNHCPRPGTLRDDCPGHPGWGWVHRGPGWRMLDPRRRRFYVLGMRTEWLELLPNCLRARHWPLWLEGMGCGRCAPWPCCGAIGYDHAERCSGDG